MVQGRWYSIVRGLWLHLLTSRVILTVAVVSVGRTVAVAALVVIVTMVLVLVVVLPRRSVVAGVLATQRPLVVASILARLLAIVVILPALRLLSSYWLVVRPLIVQRAVSIRASVVGASIIVCLLLVVVKTLSTQFQK